MKAYKKSFSIDGSDNTYEGYTLGQTWNGFDCPYFSLSQALKIVSDMDCLQFDDRMINIIDNTYTEEVENIEPCVLETVDGGLIVYPIGLNAWCWMAE